jgi:hypothetical protein
MSTDVKTKTFAMSYDNLEAAISDFLYRMNVVNRHTDDIVSIDIGIPLNEEGLIEFDVEIVETKGEQTVDLTNVIQLTKKSK